MPACTPKSADTPSTVKLFALVLCPAMLNCPGVFELEAAITTPGVSCNRVLKLRPFIGRLSTSCLSMTVLTEPDSVFTSGAPPWTVTISEIAPSGSLKLIARASCTWITMSGLMIVLNPILET